MVKTINKRSLPNDLTNLDGKLLHLYNQLQSIKNASPQNQALQKFAFEGQSLQTLTKTLIHNLNQRLDEYKKQYVAGMLIFIFISKIDIQKDIFSKLKPLFYQNLSFLLSHVTGLGEMTQLNQKGNAQRKSLRVILQIITDLHCNNKKKMAKIYTNQFIQNVCLLSIPHDSTVIKPMMRILSQALKFGNKVQRQKIALKMYEVLLFNQFPEKLIHIILYTCVSVLGVRSLSGSQNHSKVINILKAKVMMSLEQKQELVNEKYIVSFICENQKQSFTMFEVIKMLELTSKSSFTKKRVQFLQKATKLAIQTIEDQTQILLVLNSNYKNSNFLQILTSLVPQISSESFLKLLEWQLFERVLYGIGEKKVGQNSVVQIEMMKQLIKKSKEINMSIWAYLQGIGQTVIGIDCLLQPTYFF